MVNHKHFTYRVNWSEEDQEYVALCAEFPSLSFLDEDMGAALDGIVELVRQVVADMNENGEPIPEPIAEKQYSGKFQVRIWFLIFLYLAITSPISASNTQDFLPDKLELITPINALQLQQFAVIAPDGSDLIGSDSIEVQGFAKEPPGSEHWITSVAFSKDGLYLAAGSYDTSVRIWDMETGKRVQTLLGHQEMVNDVAFSPDGRLIASGSGEYEWYQDFSVRLWDSETGKSLSILKGHRDEVTSLSFSPDGTRIASASLDGTVRVWDIERSDLSLLIPASEVWVRSVEFSPDGKYLLSAGDDNAVKLWDAQSGSLIRAMLHDDRVFDADFSPDQSTIASVSVDRTARIWDTATGEEITKYQITTDEKDEDGFLLYPSHITYSPSGDLLAIGVGTNIELWDIETGIRRVKLQGHLESVYDLEFNPNGTVLASSSFDGTIRFWGVQNRDK